MAVETPKKRQAKATKKRAGKDHDEAARVFAAALMSAKNKRDAEAHPVIGPIMKKLGPKGFAQLSAMAENQKLTSCSNYARSPDDDD